MMVGLKFFYQRKNILLILGSTVIIAYVMRTHKVMFDALLLCCRSRSAYLHATIYLPTVAVQDRAPELLSYLQGKFCLTDSRRT